jgi:hypothetical protein
VRRESPGVFFLPLKDVVAPHAVDRSSSLVVKAVDSGELVLQTKREKVYLNLTEAGCRKTLQSVV